MNLSCYLVQISLREGRVRIVSRVDEVAPETKGNDRLFQLTQKLLDATRDGVNLELGQSIEDEKQTLLKKIVL